MSEDATGPQQKICQRFSELLSNICVDTIIFELTFEMEAVHRKEKNEGISGRDKARVCSHKQHGEAGRDSTLKWKLGSCRWWGPRKSQGTETQAKEAECHSFAKSLHVKAWSVSPFWKMNLTSVKSYYDPMEKDSSEDKATTVQMRIWISSAKNKAHFKTTGCVMSARLAD